MLSIAKFCNLSIGDILGTWDLGEIENFNISGIWGVYAPLGEKSILWKGGRNIWMRNTQGKMRQQL